jgi:uncharacterized protein with GYD domain
MIYRTLIFLLCLGVVGCTTVAQKKKVEEEKVQEITVLRNLLREKDQQIKEKDQKIEEMRKQLESFGVFLPTK